MHIMIQLRPAAVAHTQFVFAMTHFWFNLQMSGSLLVGFWIFAVQLVTKVFWSEVLTQGQRMSKKKQTFKYLRVDCGSLSYVIIAVQSCCIVISTMTQLTLRRN